MHVTLTLPVAHLEALVALADAATPTALIGEAVYAINWAIATRREEVADNAHFRAFWELNQHLDFGQARATFDSLKAVGARLQAEARILAAWRREDEALARAEEEAE